MRLLMILITILAGCQRASKQVAPNDYPIHIETPSETYEPPLTWPQVNYETDPEPEDLDGDGWTVDMGDCDDQNRFVHPGADEDSEARCINTVDDDCDGLFDGEEELCIPFVDLDGDGFSIAEGDCEPFDDLIHPLQVEICNDMEDNDCDGWFDHEDPDCPPLVSLSLSALSASQTVHPGDVATTLIFDVCNHSEYMDAWLTDLTVTVAGDWDGELTNNFHRFPQIDERFDGCWLDEGAPDGPDYIVPMHNATVTFTKTQIQKQLRTESCYVFFLTCQVAPLFGPDNVFGFSLLGENSVRVENEDGEPLTGRQIDVGAWHDPGINLLYDVTLSVVP